MKKYLIFFYICYLIIFITGCSTKNLYVKNFDENKFLLKLENENTLNKSKVISEEFLINNDSEKIIKPTKEKIINQDLFSNEQTFNKKLKENIIIFNQKEKIITFNDKDEKNIYSFSFKKYKGIEFNDEELIDNNKINDIRNRQNREIQKKYLEKIVWGILKPKFYMELFYIPIEKIIDKFYEKRKIKNLKSN